LPVTDETDVLASFDGIYAAACDARDVTALLAYFAPDDDISWWGSGGSEQFAGPEGFRRFAEYITHVQGQISFEWDERKARIEDDVAWVNALGLASVVTGSAKESIPYRVTMVFLRRDGRWLLHTYHGSEPQPG
jgi:uncharacterized protein (TIGR02246 family)